MTAKAKIFTLTLNPAIDVHYTLDSIAVGCANAARLVGRDSGGKGLNVSRALAAVGVPSLAVIAVGDVGGEEYIRGIKGVEYATVGLDGAVRENINLHTGTGVTVIAPEGPSVDVGKVEEIEELLWKKGITRGDLVVFSGRISTASDKGAILDLLRRLSDDGVKLILDSASLTLDEIVSVKPLLIKPNEEELRLLLDEAVSDPCGAIRSAKRLRSMGISYVLVTLGAHGAVLAGERAHVAVAPTVDAISSTGAGDSAIAGFIHGLLSGLDEAECLRLAVTLGTAAAMTKGTLPPDPCQIKELYSKVEIVEK